MALRQSSSAASPEPNEQSVGCRTAANTSSSDSFGKLNYVARACSICRHQRRDEINDLLLAGQPQMDISRRFRVGQSSLSRHLHRHLAPRALRAVGRYDEPEEERLRSYAAGVLDRLAFNAIRAEQAAAAARQDDDVATERLWMADQRAALRDLAKVLELQARLARVLGDRPVVQVDARRQLNVLAAMSEDELRALAAGADALTAGSGPAEVVDIVDAAPVSRR